MSKNKLHLAFDKKIVTQLPLTELWNEEELLKFQRETYLSKSQIQELIIEADMQFVIANLSKKLKWIDTKENFNFWKSELKEHLCEDPIVGCRGEHFKDGYFYFASSWISPERKVIVLEMHH